MKAVTERNPKVVGLVAVTVMARLHPGHPLPQPSLFSSGYTVNARFANAAGITKGTEVMVAGVNVGTVSSVAVHGNAVDAAALGQQLGRRSRTSPRPPSRSRRCSASST